MVGELAGLAKGRLKQKQEQIAAALEGFQMPAVHRLLIQQGLEHLAGIYQQVDDLEDAIAAHLREHPEMARSAKLLESIPGMNRVSSAEVTAEVGPDVEAFPNASHLSSWGGVCPGNYESAGKRAHSHTTNGNPCFRATLNQSAWASSHKKGSEFQQRYQRLSPKLQHKGAIIAVAHALGARG